jgi:hypothetical protein
MWPLKFFFTHFPNHRIVKHFFLLIFITSFPEPYDCSLLDSTPLLCFVQSCHHLPLTTLYQDSELPMIFILKMETAMFVITGNLQHPIWLIPKSYTSMVKLFYQIALLYIQQTLRVVIIFLIYIT